MFKKAITWSVLIYGLLLMSLGYLGYTYSGSQISLMAGLGLGFLMVLSSIAMFKQNKLGVYVAIFLTFVITALFAYRYTVSEKTVPAILAVISGGMLLFLLVQAAKWKNVN